MHDDNQNLVGILRYLILLLFNFSCSLQFLLLLDMRDVCTSLDRCESFFNVNNCTFRAYIALNLFVQSAHS